MEQDVSYMRMAMELAEQGRGWTAPNPVVGAVLVREGRMIGQGYHERCGESHAERRALADCRSRGESPAGATLYVTLEPCCHHGKTPPCTDVVLDAGISRVVIGAKDANPLVGGKGIAILRAHGLEVTEGVLREECEKQNRIFFHYIREHTPYVCMKYAMTLDGKIAAAGGNARWITGEAARARVHRMRHELSAIMVGVGTVAADNPKLNCRLPETKNPIRIICDTALRTPLESCVVQTAREQRTIFASCTKDKERIAAYESLGCEVVTVSECRGRVSLNELMRELGARGIDSILLEGGGELNWAALQSGIVNEAHIYIAPKLLGGAAAKTPVAGSGVDLPDHGFFLKNRTLETVGEDICITGEINYKKSEGNNDVYGNH